MDLVQCDRMYNTIAEYEFNFMPGKNRMLIWKFLINEKIVCREGFMKIYGILVVLVRNSGKKVLGVIDMSDKRRGCRNEIPDAIWTIAKAIFKKFRTSSPIIRTVLSSILVIVH